MARIEEAVKQGELFALAMPRGSGKTAIVRHAALWAASYGHCRYAFVIGANAGKAEDSLASIKVFMRFLDLYGKDFPEIAHPVRELRGTANRAGGQKCFGRSTMIAWGKDRIVLPTVPPPKGWPKSWPLRADGMVPSSGSVIGTSGLTGEGIRGSVMTLTTGEQLRPDLVLLDDPQTDESARSLTQNTEREQLVSAGVLGMAGPGGRLAAIMPCTVIQAGDMADRILDRKLHPLWRGERTRLLRSMPVDLARWEEYFELYRRCAQKEPPDYGEAIDYYRDKQSWLEEGAEASWPERKRDWEVSAIQHAMHLYCRDVRAFFSEYQNDPLPLTPPSPGDLTADQIAGRVNRVPRGVSPIDCTRLTAFIDVQQDLLFWCVCAWADGFTGAVVDYGTYPDQRRSYFSLREALPTLSQATGVGSLEGSLFAGLSTLTQSLLGRDWRSQSGGPLRVERLLIDAGWGQSTDLVRRFCRQSPHVALLIPSFGRGISAAGNPIADWPKREGERRGLEWMIPPARPGQVRHVLYDANYWKCFLFARLGQPLGERGALTLFGTEPHAHRLFADHLTAEYRVRTTGRGREVEEWRQRPHRPDNHWLDCAAGCCVAASLLGVDLAETQEARPSGRPRISWAEQQRRKREERQRNKRISDLT